MALNSTDFNKLVGALKDQPVKVIEATSLILIAKILHEISKSLDEIAKREANE